MSSGKFASLHSGLLVRAQIGNGGFFPDASGVTPNVARLATASPAPGHVRQPRNDSASLHEHQTLSPTPARRAEVLPPGTIAMDDPSPMARQPTPARPAEPTGAQRLIAQAHERVRHWGAEERQRDSQPQNEAPAQPVSAGEPGTFPQAHRLTRPDAVPERRKAMTLRLPLQQHKALKLASVELDRTCQDIMSTALTAYLAELAGPGKTDD